MAAGHIHRKFLDAYIDSFATANNTPVVRELSLAIPDSAGGFEPGVTLGTILISAHEVDAGAVSNPEAALWKFEFSFAYPNGTPSTSNRQVVVVTGDGTPTPEPQRGELGAGDTMAVTVAASADPDFDKIDITCTGLAAEDITWTIRVDASAKALATVAGDLGG